MLTTRPTAIFGLKTLALSGIVTALMALTACSSDPSTSSGTVTRPTVPTLPTTPTVPTTDQANLGSTNDCHSQLYKKTPPLAPNKLANDSYPLCFNGFRVLYSGVSKTPIWVAERLTNQRLIDARSMPREGNFREETKLPIAARSRLADYSRSGYDRGHLAPNADMQNQDQQYDSFTLANIAPQVPDHNRKTWAKVENTAREMTEQYGSTYVVTGTAFLSATVKKINNNVMVPSHFYKAVYVPSKNRAVVFFSPNDSANQVEQISLAALKSRTGIDAFPSVSLAVKDTVMAVDLR